MLLGFVPLEVLCLKPYLATPKGDEW